MTSRGRRHRQHGNPFNVRGDVAVPDWSAVYGRRAPFAVDVGFGPGGFLVELGARHPEWNVLGLEIRQHWVDAAREAAAARGLNNVHAMVANANLHLGALLPERSVAFVSINFPDPWFKKRHQKRRVLRTDWLDVLATRMLPGAELHYASDYEAAALEAAEILVAHPRFVSPDGAMGFRPQSTTGIESERERTHLRRGQPIYRLVYRLANSQ